jgi:hypothetical protein
MHKPCTPDLVTPHSTPTRPEHFTPHAHASTRRPVPACHPQGRDVEAAAGFIDEINLLNRLKGKQNIIQLVDAQV